MFRRLILTGAAAAGLFASAAFAADPGTEIYTLPDVSGPAAGLKTSAEGAYAFSIWGKDDPAAALSTLAELDLAALPQPIRDMVLNIALSAYPANRASDALLKARLELLWRLGDFQNYQDLLTRGGPGALLGQGWRGVEVQLVTGDHDGACRRAPDWVEREGSDRSQHLAEFCAARAGDLEHLGFLRQVLKETGGLDPVLEPLLDRIILKFAPPELQPAPPAEGAEAAPAVPQLVAIADAITFAAARAAETPVDPDSLKALGPGLKAAILPPKRPGFKKGDIRAALVAGHTATALDLAADLKTAGDDGNANAAAGYARLWPWFLIRNANGQRSLTQDGYAVWSSVAGRGGTKFTAQQIVLARLLKALGAADPDGLLAAVPAQDVPAPTSGGAALADALPAFMPGSLTDNRIAAVARLHAAGMDWDAATLSLIILGEAGL